MSAQPGNISPILRPMRPVDLDAVVAIESKAYAFPWGRGIFSDCLMAGYLSVVLEADGIVVAYAIMSVAAAEGHILNLCVDKSVQRQGLGRQLLDYLLHEVEVLEVERLFLEVRPSNNAAIELYERSGFLRLGVRKDYYKAAEGREDALVFMREFLV